MSDPQTPDHARPTGADGDGSDEARRAQEVWDFVLQTIQGGSQSGAAGYTPSDAEVRDADGQLLEQHDDENNDGDDDDSPYMGTIVDFEVDIEEEENVDDSDGHLSVEEDEGDEEGEEEEEEGGGGGGDDDDDDDGVDEGRPIPYLTRRQLSMMLQGESLHHILLSTNWGQGRGMRWRRQDPNRFPKVPSEEGRKLMDSGIFGATERPQKVYRTVFDMAADNHAHKYKIGARRRSVSLRLLDRELGLGDTIADRILNKKMLAQSMVPTTDADMILRYDAPVYLGQFSDDGNFFYSATKDFRVRMYDTSNINDWHHYKTVVHPTGRWTMTDASLSPDNRWLAFTSMMPQVCLAPTDPKDDGEPYLLNLSGGVGGAHDDDHYFNSFAIFSVRFSGDGRELVAGTNSSSIIVYDIESRRVLHHLEGHSHDVNAVCFGDKDSPHLLYSGSDDATIKVWDRRSLGDGRPAGAFVGHCEGITYSDSKGDGRYILSNGKDQTMRLWDLRMAMSTADFESKDPAQQTRYSQYDYRFQRYDDSHFFKHPHDNSVVTFRGHRVERTLIRCHFSPPGSSDGRYVYSASHSGAVYIWNLDATLASVIDVHDATRKTVANVAAEEDRQSGLGNVDADTLHNRARMRQRRSMNRPLCVRDASWHPTAPVIVASSFDAENMEAGTCSVHSCDISKESNLGGFKHNLFDDRMRPMSSWRSYDLNNIIHALWA